MVTGLLQIVQSRYPITVSSLPQELDTYALFSTCVTTFVRVRFQNEYRQVQARTRPPSGALRIFAPSIIPWVSQDSPPPGPQPGRPPPRPPALEVWKRFSPIIHLMVPAPILATVFSTA